MVDFGSNRDEDAPGEGSSPAAALAVEIIRSNSRAGRLITDTEILQDLLNRPFRGAGEDKARRLWKNTIEPALKENRDITELTAEKERFFFSSRFMNEGYARILLQRGSDTLAAISEFVRQNSTVYPRPVPLDILRHPPFDLTEKEVRQALEEMDGKTEYQDIRQVTTSTGNVFLYSVLYLDADYAAMLAEWVDVGQADNP